MAPWPRMTEPTVLVTRSRLRRVVPIHHSSPTIVTCDACLSLSSTSLLLLSPTSSLCSSYGGCVAGGVYECVMCTRSSKRCKGDLKTSITYILYIETIILLYL